MVKNALQDQNIPYNGINAKDINKANQKKFFDNIYSQRLSKYSGGQADFREGWIKRLNTIKFEKHSKKKIVFIVGSSLLIIGLSIFLYKKMNK
jgi:hypothetical protein